MFRFFSSLFSGKQEDKEYTISSNQCVLIGYSLDSTVNRGRFDALGFIRNFSSCPDYYQLSTQAHENNANYYSVGSRLYCLDECELIWMSEEELMKINALPTKSRFILNDSGFYYQNIIHRMPFILKITPENLHQLLQIFPKSNQSVDIDPEKAQLIAALSHAPLHNNIYRYSAKLEISPENFKKIIQQFSRETGGDYRFSFITNMVRAMESAMEKELVSSLVSSIISIDVHQKKDQEWKLIYSKELEPEHSATSSLENNN